MTESITPKEAIELADDTLEICETLIEDNPSAAEFAQSVHDKITSMKEWIEKNDKVTEKMIVSMNNMHNAASKWLR